MRRLPRWRRDRPWHLSWPASTGHELHLVCVLRLQLADCLSLCNTDISPCDMAGSSTTETGIGRLAFGKTTGVSTPSSRHLQRSVFFRRADALSMPTLVAGVAQAAPIERPDCDIAAGGQQRALYLNSTRNQTYINNRAPNYHASFLISAADFLKPNINTRRQ